MDGLKPSKYLIDTAIKNIEGDITIDEAQELLNTYYEENSKSDTEDRTEEADKVAVRIAKILSEKAFSFTPNEYISIHKKLFVGIYGHAGKLRDYNTTKKERVLNGATVLYGSASELRATLDYDFSEEKKFSYKNLSMEEIIEWFDYTENHSYMDDESTIKLPIYPDVTFSYNQTQIIASKPFGSLELTGHTILITGMPILNAYFTDFTGDGYPEICATYSFGFGMIDNRIIIYDYANGVSYELSDRGKFDFMLRKDSQDGLLYVDKLNYNSDELVETGRLVFKNNCIQIE